MQVTKYIASDLEEEMKKTIKKVREVFKIKINRVVASRIIAQKSKHSSYSVNEKELLKLIAGENP